MAKRFGGKFSPGGTAKDSDAQPRAAYDGARVDPVGARANIMFIPAIPLVFMSLNDGAVGLVLGLAAAGLLTAAAFLLREGLRAEAAYKSRKVARRPAFPRKLVSAVLTGLGIAIAAYKSEPGLIAPILYGAAAGGLHCLSFGLDPMKSKGMEGIDKFQQDRVARARIGSHIAQVCHRNRHLRLDVVQWNQPCASNAV